MYYYATPHSTDEIYHHGVRGMRWGVRRYVNKDGSLTPLGKKHYQNYSSHMANRKRVDAEGEKLMRKSKKLSKDFGGTYKNIDNEDYFEYVARQNGLNTDKYWDAVQNRRDFYNYNQKSINKWAKIDRKRNKITKAPQPKKQVYLEYNPVTGRFVKKKKYEF